MELVEFFDKVETHKEITGCAVDTDKNAFIVEDELYEYVWTVPFAEILKNTWEVLESVILGKREPEVLKHLTRVVGYFSFTRNWNRSKIGELKDRQKGNYAIDEGEK